MTKLVQNYMINLSDVLTYYESEERKVVLRALPTMNGDFKKLSNKYHILAYLDSVVKFPLDNKMQEFYYNELFSLIPYVIDDCQIFKFGFNDFVNEIRYIQQSLLHNYPIEKIAVSPESKCVYSLFNDSQVKFYKEDYRHSVALSNMQAGRKMTS